MHKTILLIDNDEYMNLFLRDTFLAFCDSPYDVKVATSIAAAEKIIAQEVPLAIFIEPRTSYDANSKGSTNHRNCTDFIKNLRSKSETKDVSIIVFSAHDNEFLKEEMLAAGATTFLIKGKLYGPDFIREFNAAISR